MAAPVLNLLRTSRLPIAAQLRLEEALLRTSKENWMLVNDGAGEPAIVLGISGCARHCERPALGTVIPSSSTTLASGSPIDWARALHQPTNQPTNQVPDPHRAASLTSSYTWTKPLRRASR
jgi:hypothetical protein